MTESASLRQVIAACLDDYAEEHRLSPRQWQVCCHVLDCRTEAMGGLALRCENCGAQQPAYHSCRDRHCPRCQRRASEQWCERQRAAVLPVSYHHLVFTLPHALDPWVAIHEREIYDLLFETVWSTLGAFGADPKRLDGQLGMTAVLHTWGQTLTRHVHLHCLVPGGALACDGSWHPAKSTYLFPVRALSRHVRGGFVRRLRRAFEDGRLARIEDPAQVAVMLDRLMTSEWVVYSKPCITRTETVVDYLGRYSHRIALSDGRILAFEDGKARLAWKDYRDGKKKVMQLDGEELLRRFLLHVLPKGFMRIRHFGFLANRCRAQRLGQIRKAIAAQAQGSVSEAPERAAAGDVPRRCPRCRIGHLRVVGELPPRPKARAPAGG
jgi:hypothetical protein